MRFPRTLGLLCALFIGFAAKTPAEEAVLTPNADTTLFQQDPDNNLGLASLAAGTTESFGQKSRALIRFDVANSIPANATITSATLTVNVVGAPFTGGEASTFDIFRVLKSWTEGDKSGNRGSPASTGETTWNNRAHPSTAWTDLGAAAGSDYVSVSSGSQAINDLGPYTFGSTANMVSDVALWKNANTNFGWILISRSEANFGTARRFGSLEDETFTPTLTIQYTIPAPTGSPIITNLSKVGNQLQFTFNAAADTTYSIETNAVLSASGWGVLTNFSASGTPVVRTVTNAINSATRYYRVKTP